LLYLYFSAWAFDVVIKETTPPSSELQESVFIVTDVMFEQQTLFVYWSQLPACELEVFAKEKRQVSPALHELDLIVQVKA
jgi:hypothetical protein